MIGTTFKLGFDGTSVSKGLGNVSRTLGSFSKQIGVGMAQKVGHGVTDLLGRVLMSVPETFKETADWMGNLTDMSNQTGVSISKLVEMEEALRMSGATAADTSRMISILADNLHTAATEGGPAVDALKKLGLSLGDWANLPVDRQFENIMRAVSQTEPGFKGLESIMSDLFGARMGYKLIRFARQFDGNMADAARNVGPLGKAMEKAAAPVDNWMDAWGRWNNLKRSVSSMFIEHSMRMMGGSRGVDAIFNTLDIEKFRPIFDQIGMMVSRNLEAVLQQFAAGKGMDLIGDYFKNLGRLIGQGFRAEVSPGAMLRAMVTGQPTASIGTGGRDLAVLIHQGNTLLERIERKTGGPAKFA
jgi:hypothetical protein